MRVYIAGPYTHGDVAQNVRAAIDAANQLMDAGHQPFTPHLSHFHHLVHPRDYEDWLALDLAWLPVCEALVVLPGYSPGTQREIVAAAERGIPTYLSVQEFLGAVT